LAYGVTGRTLYAVVRNNGGEVWNGSAFETYAGGNWTTYDVALTEQGSSGYYVGTFPALIVAAGSYQVESRDQSGGSPATTHTIVGNGELEWTGSAVASEGSIQTYVDTEVAAIKAKTDQLTFTVALKVDATATVDVDEEAIADAIIAEIDIPTVEEIAEGLTGSDITVVSALTGNTLSIYRGTEYSAANGTSVAFNYTALPDLTAGAAKVRIHIPGQDALIDKALTITNAGTATQTITLVLTGAETSTLVPRAGYVYAIEYKTASATSYSVATEGALIARSQ
jgi:hypothetical protein